jgi:hypothetical protein
MHGWYFILDENKNVIPATLFEWSDFWGDWSKRCLFEDYLGDFRIVTIFSGIDEERFETAILNPEIRTEVYPYDTYEEARKGHKHHLKRLKRKIAT